jgi:LPS sulfotransferase NodH
MAGVMSCAFAHMLGFELRREAAMTIMLPPELLDLKNVHLDTIKEIAAVPPAPLSARALQTQYVFVCFTNRNGSNFLCEAIASSGFLNTAGEFFNGDTIVDHTRDLGLRDFGEFFNHLVAHISKNGHMVSKLAATHLVMLAKFGVLDQILAHSHFIILERGDKLGQAISLSIADQTQQWTSRQPAARTDDQLIFKYDQLDRIIGGLTREHYIWDLFFSLNGIVPLIVSYEALSLDPRAALAQISRYLNLDLEFESSKIKVSRQTRAINKLWRDRYLTGNSAR